MSEYCSKRIYGSGRTFRGSQCSLPPIVQVDGEWFCRVHNPEAVAKRKAALNAKWDQRNKADQARWRREAAQRDAVSFLQIIVDGYTYDPGSSDLDDEQPIHVRMTLGDYRRARRMLGEVGRTV